MTTTTTTPDTEPTSNCWCDSRCEWFGCDCPGCGDYEQLDAEEDMHGGGPIHHDLDECTQCGTRAELASPHLGRGPVCARCFHTEGTAP